MASRPWQQGPWRRAWRLAVLGVALRACGVAWGVVDPRPHHHLLVLAGAALSVAGVVAALRERSSRGRAVDSALEILLATVALGFVVVALDGSRSPVEVAPAAALPVLDLALLWLMSRVADLTEECRRVLRWAMAAVCVPLVPDVLDALAAHGIVAVPPAITRGLLAVGLVASAVALAIPGRRDPGPASPVSTVGLQPGDALAIMVPAVLGPLVALAEGSAGGAGRSWVAVGGGMVLPLAVIALLLRQLRLRARREHLAHHDPLTGLPNQRLFNDRVEVELARVRRDGAAFAVMFLDLDGFKDVNDSLGHDVGDQFLRNVARRLSEAVREGDTVARVGGDEFTILAPGVTNLESAHAMAEDVRARFADPVHADGHPLFTDVSIGVVVATDPHLGADELIKQADTAMYQAKGRGRGRVQVWTSEMNGRARVRLALENELRLAIERDQLEVHYQPKVRAEDHAVVGHEALVRWNHPRLGQISPAAFVPLAEAKGMIGSIGRWVLGEACRQARTWMDDGRFRGPIAVNISALELVETPLDELVEAAIEASGIHPRMLEIELTESALLRDIDTTAASIATIRARGVTVSLDDFGTGYSGLSYLVRIPLDRLKIDRCFVETVRPGTEASPVVEAILALAQGLGLEVVAEGVETRYQADWLRQRGCDTLQGFLFGAPAPVRLSTLAAAAPAPVPVAVTDTAARRIDRALLAVCQSVELDDPADLEEALVALGAGDAEPSGQATMRAARRLTLAAMLRANTSPSG